MDNGSLGDNFIFVNKNCLYWRRERYLNCDNYNVLLGQSWYSGEILKLFYPGPIKCHTRVLLEEEHILSNNRYLVWYVSEPLFSSSFSA